MRDKAKSSAISMSFLLCGALESSKSEASEFESESSLYAVKLWFSWPSSLSGNDAFIVKENFVSLCGTDVQETEPSSISQIR